MEALAKKERCNETLDDGVLDWSGFEATFASHLKAKVVEVVKDEPKPVEKEVPKDEAANTEPVMEETQAPEADEGSSSSSDVSETETDGGSSDKPTGRINSSIFAAFGAPVTFGSLRKTPRPEKNKAAEVSASPIPSRVAGLKPPTSPPKPVPTPKADASSATASAAAASVNGVAKDEGAPKDRNKDDDDDDEEEEDLPSLLHSLYSLPESKFFQVVRKPRQFRTVVAPTVDELCGAPSTSSSLSSSSSPSPSSASNPMLLECIKVFTKPWTYVQEGAPKEEPPRAPTPTPAPAPAPTTLPSPAGRSPLGSRGSPGAPSKARSRSGSKEQARRGRANSVDSHDLQYVRKRSGSRIGLKGKKDKEKEKEKERGPALADPHIARSPSMDLAFPPSLLDKRGSKEVQERMCTPSSTGDHRRIKHVRSKSSANVSLSPILRRKSIKASPPRKSVVNLLSPTSEAAAVAAASAATAAAATAGSSLQQDNVAPQKDGGSTPPSPSSSPPLAPSPDPASSTQSSPTSESVSTAPAPTDSNPSPLLSSSAAAATTAAAAAAAAASWSAKASAASSSWIDGATTSSNKDATCNEAAPPDSPSNSPAAATAAGPTTSTTATTPATVTSPAASTSAGPPLSSLDDVLLAASSRNLVKKSIRYGTRVAPSSSSPNSASSVDLLGMSLQRNPSIGTSFLTPSDIHSEPFAPPASDNAILVEAHSMFFAQAYGTSSAGANDPLFCTLALYDVQKAIKLSEDFHFCAAREASSSSDGGGAGDEAGGDDSLTDNGQPWVAKSVQAPPAWLYGRRADDASLSTRVLFNLPGSPSTSVHLVVKINRLLQTKAEKGKKGAGGSRTDLLPSDIVLEPYAWTSMPLFSGHGKLVTGVLGDLVCVEQFVPVTRGVSPSDTLICELARTERDFRKAKSVQGDVFLQIRKVSTRHSPPTDRADSMLRAVHPRSSAAPDSGVTKEVELFGATTGPHLAYINNMYVYPETVSIKHPKANVQIEVKLKSGSETTQSVYTNLPGVNLGSGASSCVHPKERKPQFNDEFKLRLPSSILPTHHLLFTFYHVNTGQSKKSRRIPLAHAVLMLGTNSHVLADGKHTLALAASPLSDDYLNRLGAQRWMDGGKPTFSLRTRLLSSVVTNDQSLARFFGVDDAKKDEDRLEAVRAVANASPESCLKFLPSILSKLFHGLCTWSPSLSREAFAGVVSVLKTVQGHPSVNVKDVLSDYAQYTFDIGSPSSAAAAGGAEANGDKNDGGDGDSSNESTTTTPPTTRYLHEELCAHWRSFIEDMHPSMRAFKQSQFLLHIMVKSMALKLAATGESADDSNRSTRFSSSFTANLDVLITNLLFDKTRTMTLKSLSFYAMFLKSLLNLMDRGFVFNVIYRYMCHLERAFSNVQKKKPSSGSKAAPAAAVVAVAAAVPLPAVDPASSTTAPASDTTDSADAEPSKEGAAVVAAPSDGVDGAEVPGLAAEAPAAPPSLVSSSVTSVPTRVHGDSATDSSSSGGTSTGSQETLLITIKFMFLKILCDTDQYVPINMPRPYKLTRMDGLVARLWRRHFLVGLLLRELQRCFRMRKPLRDQALITLRSVLYKHDVDPAHQQPAHKRVIVGMYFPVISILTEKQALLNKLDPKEEADWMACFVFLLRHTDAALVRSYWGLDTQTRQVAFLNLCSRSLDVFATRDGKHTKRYEERCLVMARVLSIFTIDFGHKKNYSNDPTCPLLAPAVRIALTLLGMPGLRGAVPSPDFVEDIYNVVCAFCCCFAPALCSPLCGELSEALCFQMLRQASSPQPIVQRKASALFLRWLQANWFEVGSLSSVKTQAAVATSKIVAEMDSALPSAAAAAAAAAPGDVGASSSARGVETGGSTVPIAHAGGDRRLIESLAAVKEYAAKHKVADPVIMPVEEPTEHVQEPMMIKGPSITLPPALTSRFGSARQFGTSCSRGSVTSRPGGELTNPSWKNEIQKRRERMQQQARQHQEDMNSPRNSPRPHPKSARARTASGGSGNLVKKAVAGPATVPATSTATATATAISTATKAVPAPAPAPAVVESPQPKYTVSFCREMDKLIGRVSKLLHYSASIAKHEHDAEMKSDLFLNVSGTYTDTPDLQLVWLDNLRSLHCSRLAWEEAAMCQVQVAFYILRFLVLFDPNVVIGGVVKSDPPLPATSAAAEGAPPPPADTTAAASESTVPILRLPHKGEQVEDIASLVDLSDFQNVDPNYNYHMQSLFSSDNSSSRVSTQVSPSSALTQPALAGPSPDANRYQSSVWSVDGLTAALEDAADLNVKAKMYETAIELYSILQKVHAHTGNYTSLQACLTRFHVATGSLVGDAGKDAGDRVFGKFYRVGFYGGGTRLESLKGKEFIYRRLPTNNLALFSTEMRETFGPCVGGQDNVAIVGNDKTAEQLSMDDEKIYIQLASVLPYFEADELAGRATSFLRNYGVSKFKFETGFSAPGVSKEERNDVQYQQKRKTIFHTQFAFPYLKSRIAVTRTDHIILSPIENAIEIIAGRVASLRAQLENKPPRLNMLQQVIQGSVVPMVNAGPLKICETFLGPDAAAFNYPPKALTRLKRVIQELVGMCGIAINVNKALIGPAHLGLQTLFEKHYKELAKKVREYAGLTGANSGSSNQMIRQPSHGEALTLTAATAAPAAAPSSSPAAPAASTATPRSVSPLPPAEVERTNPKPKSRVVVEVQADEDTTQRHGPISTTTGDDAAAEPQLTLSPQKDSPATVTRDTEGGDGVLAAAAAAAAVTAGAESSRPADGRKEPNGRATQ